MIDNWKGRQTIVMIGCTFWLGGILTILAISADETENNFSGVVSENNVAVFLQSVSNLHETERQIREFVEDEAKMESIAQDALKLLKNKPIPDSMPAELFLKAYQMRLLLLLDKESEAEKLARKLAITETWAAESVETLGDIGVISTELQIKLLGGLLPLSIWIQRADMASNLEARSFPRADGRPHIPSHVSLRKKALAVANLWEEHGLYNEASLAYREAIYAINMRETLISPQLYERGWLGVDVCDLWLSAAKCDWRAGRRAEAFEALAKGMIFGSEEHFERGREIANRFVKYMKEDKAADDKSPSYVSIPREALRQIVLKYTSPVNAHPRALAILDEYGWVFTEEEHRSIRQEINECWLETIERHLQVYRVREGVLYLFGHNIYPEDERLEVRVLPPLSEEAIENVAKALGKDQKRSDE